MYTPYTLDTYQTFTGESHEEQEKDDIIEESENNLSFNDIEFKYDHKKLVNMLYDTCYNLLTDNIIDDVILKIEKDGEPWSPREYNFQTDQGSFIFTVDHEKLAQYCFGDNQEDYHENKIQSCSGFMWLGNKEQTMLNYYLHHKTAKEFTERDYIEGQHDMLSGNGGWYEVIETIINPT